MSKEIFDKIYDEIENMTQEDVDQMNQNIDNEVKNNQIKKFGVEYDHLSIFYNEFSLFCDAINQVMQNHNKLILENFTIHKIKLNEDLFENENIEFLFTHNNKPNEFKHIKLNDRVFNYFFNNEDNESSKQYANILNFVLNKSYNLESQKDRQFKNIINQLIKGCESYE